MKTKLVLLLLLILNIQYSYSENMKSQDKYVFVDVARIRNKPQIDSSIIDKLLLGHKISIVEKTKSSYQLNGIKEYWYKIRYVKDNQTKEGFIWGGIISCKSMQYKNSSLVLGMMSFKENEGYLSGIKIISNNKLISQLSFKINYNSCPDEIPQIDLQLFNNLGYKKFENVLKVSLSSEYLSLASFEKNNRNIIIINDNQLYLMGIEYFQGEGGVGSSYEIFIFPKEQDGIENYIVYKNIENKFSETQNRDITVKNITKKYIWENNTLIESK